MPAQRDIHEAAVVLTAKFVIIDSASARFSLPRSMPLLLLGNFGIP
jgi:hypothetical protein